MFLSGVRQGVPEVHPMKSSVMVIGILLMISCSFMPLTARGGEPAGKAAGRLETATFAGGCFWCMESPFDKLSGVVSVTAGYTGGTLKNPTYVQVSAGGTGHAESAQIVFDPARIGYNRLLDVYWHNIDPTRRNGQFCDHGHQYRTAIFYHGDAQRRMALASRAALEKSKPFKGDIVTEIIPAGPFYPAEEYHQHYYKKNPIRYHYYRSSCGRDRRLKELWGDAAGH
jgi:peptide-methionine (S)-S-oxide reductase